MKSHEQVALVTGGGTPRGIGRCIAENLTRDGITVIVADLNYEGASETASNIIKKNSEAKIFPLKLDVTNWNEVEEEIEKVVNQFGKIDILVNNAGVAFSTSFEEINEKEWDIVQDINIKGVFFLTQAVAKHMKDNNYGRIINMSSVAGKRGGGIFGGAHYAASKAAVLGFTKTISRELSSFNITCNCVVPGFVDTDITKGRIDEVKLQEIVATIPVGRKGNVDDVANAVKFLSLKESSFITGEDIDVNGGLHID